MLIPLTAPVTVTSADATVLAKIYGIADNTCTVLKLKKLENKK